MPESMYGRRFKSAIEPRNYHSVCVGLRQVEEKQAEDAFQHDAEHHAEESNEVWQSESVCIGLLRVLFYQSYGWSAMHFASGDVYV